MNLPALFCKKHQISKLYILNWQQNERAPIFLYNPIYGTSTMPAQALEALHAVNISFKTFTSFSKSNNLVRSTLILLRHASRLSNHLSWNTLIFSSTATHTTLSSSSLYEAWFPNSALLRTTPPVLTTSL